MTLKWMAVASLAAFLQATSVLAQSVDGQVVVVDPPGLSLTDTAPIVPIKYSGIKYELKATGKTLNEGEYKDCSVDVYYWVSGYYSSYRGIWIDGYYAYRYTNYYPESFQCERTRYNYDSAIKYVPFGVRTRYRKSTPEMKSTATPLVLSQFSKSMEACAKEQGNAINSALAAPEVSKQFAEKLQFKSVSIQVISDSTNGESGIGMKAKIDGSKAPELVIVAIAKDEKGCKEKISQSAFTELLQKWSDRK